MEVGEKYIIEISDVITTNNGNIAKIKGFNALVFDEVGLGKLAKTDIDPKFFTNEVIVKSLTNAQQHGHERGYNEGYDKGFKAGVKHQESMTPPKGETRKPHEPQIGDIYRHKENGCKFIVVYNDTETLVGLYPDGDCSYWSVDELDERYDFVENRAGLVNTIKGALA